MDREEKLEFIFNKYSNDKSEVIKHAVMIDKDQMAIYTSDKLDEIFSVYDFDIQLLANKILKVDKKLLNKDYKGSKADNLGGRVYDISININDESVVATFILIEKDDSDFEEDKESQAIFSLLHEIGHKFYEYDDEFLNEDFANTFAYICCVKDNVCSEKFLRQHINNLSVYLNSDDDLQEDRLKYYTADTSLVANSLIKDIDFNDMSLFDIRDMAKMIVDNFSLPVEKRFDISNIYQDKDEKGRNTIYLDDLADIMVATEDFDLYRAGKLILESTVTKLSINQMKEASKEKQKFWDDFDNFIRNKDSIIGFSLNPLDLASPDKKAVVEGFILKFKKQSGLNPTSLKLI